MPRIIALGNVRADGTIYNATPGITIDTVNNVFDENMYRVQLPEGLVLHDNYIIQLTQEFVETDQQAYESTSIGYIFRRENGFTVGISTRFSSYLKGNWSFVLYDL
ncbi:hypothetical protein H8K90_03355 [Winogradskyella echinorum]|uniref:Uncharacterized protein n=1 Tax=Winogradskyella echinorum TaxID=538189 RepID=A0ABR6XY32_9FLAO|nr:hypothetical protein [Winogradskyella echinorum]MBC3845407.1 hypothetical protein [Winogradskyella echinorum]MBC5749755.1 hypothetical protein [Winogradskyella echinorum]